MSDLRVGSLDNPGHYGARSLAVYENGAGLYFKMDGVREKIHGATRWTKLDGTTMRGRSVYNDQARVPLDGWSDDAMSDGGQDDEEAQIEAAIRASLEDMESASPPSAVPTADVAGDEAPAGGDADGSGGGRTCAVCLTEDSVMLMRPCNHLCACETCSRRLAGRACVLCRRPVRSMERVFF